MRLAAALVALAWLGYATAGQATDRPANEVRQTANTDAPIVVGGGTASSAEAPPWAPPEAASDDVPTSAEPAAPEPGNLSPSGGNAPTPPPPTVRPTLIATATPTGSANPTGSATPPPAPPTPAGTATATFEGNGSQITERVLLIAGQRLVTATASGTGCVYIGTLESTASLLPADPSLRTTVLIPDDVGSAQGWFDVYMPAGEYFMTIESDCAWTVTIPAP